MPLIVEIMGAHERQSAARAVLEALPDWFGNVESREEYIENSAVWTTFGAVSPPPAAARGVQGQCPCRGMGRRPISPRRSAPTASGRIARRAMMLAE